MTRYHLLACLIPIFCVGCGLMPRTGEPSLALQIADEMSVPATDLSRKDYNELSRRNSGSSINYDGVISGAVAMDPAMMLLGADSTVIWPPIP